MTDYLTTLINDEGLELKPYYCSEGKLTIGIGRNLADRGISRDEAVYLANNDIRIAERTARKYVTNFDELNDARKIVVVSMAFQLGEPSFKKFKNTIAAINAMDFDKAAIEMLDSKWARKDTPERARRLSQMMQTG